MAGKILTMVYPIFVFFIVEHLVSVFDVEVFTEIKASWKMVFFLSWLMGLWVFIRISWEYIYKPVWKSCKG